MPVSVKGLRHGCDKWGLSNHLDIGQSTPRWRKVWQAQRALSSASSLYQARPKQAASSNDEKSVTQNHSRVQHGRARSLHRDFFLSVLNSSATKRDAKSYISKFHPSKKEPKPKPELSKPIHEHSYYDSRRVQRPGVNLGGFYVPTRAVDQRPVFTREAIPDTPLSDVDGPVHVALVKIRAPQDLDSRTLEGIGFTLSQLTLLGLSCAVVIDCNDIGTEGQLSGDQQKRRLYAIEQADRVVASFGSASGIGARRLDNVLTISGDGSESLIGPHRGRVKVAFRKQLVTPIKKGIIPVVAPIAYTAAEQKALEVNPDDVVLALTRELAGIVGSTDSADKDAATMTKEIATRQSEICLDKIILLDPLGGIPSVHRPNGAHVFINMEQEYQDIRAELTAKGPSPLLSIHLRNLNLLKETLAILPPAASAISTTPQEAANSSRFSPSSTPEVGTRRQKNPLIHNLLTDKPVFSSSLPAGRLGSNPTELDAPRQLPTPTTSIKRGMPLTFLPDPRLQPWTPSLKHNLSLHSPSIDLPRLIHLLTSSFSRPLDTVHYLSRINPIFAGLIIAGNYEGCALFTWETPAGAPPGTAPIPYLDKFAVLRESQGGGTGVADMLFTAMVRTALPDGVCWRSRRDNVVNKWYFERARGSWEIPGAEGENGKWTMFWTTEGVEKNQNMWDAYVSVCGGVVPSWADGSFE